MNPNTRVREPESGREGIIVPTPEGYFLPDSVRPPWMVFVLFDGDTRPCPWGRDDLAAVAS